MKMKFEVTVKVSVVEEAEIFNSTSVDEISKHFAEQLKEESGADTVEIISSSLEEVEEETPPLNPKDYYL